MPVSPITAEGAIIACSAPESPAVLESVASLAALSALAFVKT